MKWTTTIFALALTTLMCGSLWNIEGGSISGGSSTVAPAYPFFDRNSQLGCSDFFINITHPANGGTIYASTQYTNVSIRNINYCYYRINSNLWNYWDCKANSTDRITYPTGQVTLDVVGFDYCGMEHWSTSVFYNWEFARRTITSTAWVFIMAGGLIVWVRSRKRRGFEGVMAERESRLMDGS